MKIKTIIFLSLIPCIGLCQQKEPRPPASVYVDSIKIDTKKVSVSSTSIANVNITNKTSGGEVYFTLVKNTKFLTLSEIVKTYLKIDDSDRMLFIVDDKLVDDKKDVRIDSAIIKKVLKMDLVNVNYLKKGFNQMIIVKVVFNTSKRPDDNDTIWFRGTK